MSLRIYAFGYWQVWPFWHISKLDTFTEYHLYLIPFLRVVLHVDR